MDKISCSICGVVYAHSADNFYKSKKSRSGLDTACKECVKAKAREWRKENKIRKKLSDALYAKRKSMEISAYQRDYRQKNSAKAKEYFEEYSKKNREKLLRQKREYFQRPEVKERVNKYQKSRRKSDPKYRLFSAFRSAVSGMVSGKIGATRHLPYTAEELCRHLERQFVKGMSWENYGDWHVDHITPCASFNISGDPKCNEFQACWALTNLRPMWASENMSKQDKITHLL